ncbi:MAG TPA: DUF1361 domain-containing protein [Humisphaera sp.]
MKPQHARSRPSIPLQSRGFSPALFLPAAVATGVSLALLAVRIRYTNGGRHLSLPWDLFLGWFPVGLAWLFHRVAGRPEPRRWALVASFLGWLLFFPNAPYLLTEVVHLAATPAGAMHRSRWVADLLGASGPPRPPPFWLEFLLLSSVGFAGLLLTVAQVAVVRAALAGRSSPRAAGRFVVAALLLAGVGVALGRYERLNSWEAVSAPEKVVDHAVAATTQFRVPVTGLVFGLMLVLVELTVRGVRGDREE